MSEKWIVPEPIEPMGEPQHRGQQSMVRRHGALVPSHYLPTVVSEGTRISAITTMPHMKFEMTPWAVRNSPKWWW